MRKEDRIKQRKKVFNKRNEKYYSLMLVILPILMVSIVSLIDFRIQGLDNEVDEVLLNYETTWKNYDEFKTFMTRRAIVSCNLDVLKSMYNISKNNLTGQTISKYENVIKVNVTRTAYLALKNAYDSNEELSTKEKEILYGTNWGEIDDLIRNLENPVQDKINGLVRTKADIEAKIDRLRTLESLVLWAGALVQVSAAVYFQYIKEK